MRTVAAVRAVAWVAWILVVAAIAGGAQVASVARVAPDEMLVDVGFSLSEFRFETIDGRDYVRADGMNYLAEPGLPGLPLKPIEVVLPYAGGPAAVEVVRVNEAPVEGAYDIVPIQPPRILGQAAAPWVAGREAIYASDQPYPSSRVGGVRQGFMGDTRLVSFYVSPFRWNPATGQLLLATDLQVRIKLGDSPVARSLRPRTAPRPFLEALRRSVANPEDVGAPAGKVPAGLPGALLGSSALEEEYHEYVIVTTAALASYFQPLVDWKVEKGLSAELVTREWIAANYTGVNIQEQIRSFITDAYQTWGTSWILIGGDTEQIPSRQVYAMDYEMGYDGNRIRSDLYYSDLDGTWNANGVLPYGEVADSVDMYPDVVVGRAPTENGTEVEVFVEKVLTYEQDPPAGYALDMLMAGEVLWDNPLTDAGVGLNMIDDECIPPRFDPILKLYQTLGNESRETVLAAMSAGPNVVLHDGHCWYDVMGVGGDYLGTLDADTLSNSPRNFILNSIGCWPAAIDHDCIAERFVNNPNGGCVAFVGNCRYGWGSPGNPGFGYSDIFQREFARVLFTDNVCNLGLANALSKSHFVPYAQDENVFRCNEYQVNLLGDPEMPVWTDEPRDLVVSAPEQVISPQGDVRVVVADDVGAVEGALVCLMNGSDVYLVGNTDLAGTVVLSVTTASADSLLLTVTAFNHRPDQRKIEVISQGRLLAAAEYAIVDGGDAKPNPGETVDVAIAVRNSGSEAAKGVWGVLRARDGRAEVLDSTVYYGLIGATSTSWGDGRFTVAFDPSCSNAEGVGFDLVLTDTTGTSWTSAVQPVVAAPVFSVTSYGMHDLLGDGDWVAEPGETVIVTLVIANDGLTAGEPTAIATSIDPMLVVTDSVTYGGTVEPGEVGHSLHRVVISSGCPALYAGGVEVAITSPGGYAFLDTVYVNVGDLSFADDCESGQGAWVRAGSPDLWHLSTYRTHSGAASWCFGDSTAHEYTSNSNSSITASGLVAGEECKLAFWFWYEFTTYGVDGLYVIVSANGVPDTVDYIGSGGALNISSRWVPWERVLDVEPGDTLAVKFAFKSDNADVAEGIYIDDISLSGKTPGEAAVPPVDPAAAPSFTACPNPAAGSVLFSFSGTEAAAVMDVFDIRGRCVASLVKPAGARSVVWDLDAGAGRVAPGIYLASVRDGGYNQARKIVVLR
jgi:hypothetical protein